MFENQRSLSRRIAWVVAVPVVGAGLVGVAQLVAPSPRTVATELAGSGGQPPSGVTDRRAGRPTGAPQDGGPASSAPASSSRAAAPAGRAGLLVRGRYVLRGPATAPAGASVLFVLQGPRRVVRTDPTAPFAVPLDTRALPDGEYTLTVATVLGTRRTSATTTRLTIANHVAVGAGRAHPTAPGGQPSGTAAAPASRPGEVRAGPTGTGAGAAGTGAAGPGTAPGHATVTTPAGRTTATTTSRGGTSVATVPGDPTRSPVASFAAQVVTLTNARRASAGCPALTVDGTLTTVAQAHSQDMAARDYFGHDTPEGVSPFDRMTAAGYRYQAAAENIAAGQRTPQDVVTAWMNSAGHRANILNCGLRQIGVGYATGGQYGTYWTQDFGTPR